MKKKIKFWDKCVDNIYKKPKEAIANLIKLIGISIEEAKAKAEYLSTLGLKPHGTWFGPRVASSIRIKCTRAKTKLAYLRCKQMRETGSYKSLRLR